MTLRVFATLVILISFTTSASADPMRFPYWQMIKDIVSTLESQPPPPVTISENNFKTSIEYPFELMRHLRVSDLLNAAVEGAQEARLQAALGKPAVEIDALVLNNVALAMEYLPMLIRSENDLGEIALLMEKRDQDPVLRYYLLQNTFPGIAPPTFLSLSLPEFIRENDEEILKATLAIAKHPMENPEMQALALRIYTNRLTDKYERCLQGDPAIVALMAENDNTDIVGLAKDHAPEFSKETRQELKTIRSNFHDFAFDIAGHISESSVRDARVQEEAKRALTYIRDNIIGINQEILNAFLAGKPYNTNPLSMPPIHSPLTTEPQEIDSLGRIDALMETDISNQFEM